jgi:hypothetical protein
MSNTKEKVILEREMLNRIKSRLENDEKLKGGFISAILPFVAPLITEAVSWGAKKIFGNGVQYMDGGCDCEMEGSGETVEEIYNDVLEYKPRKTVKKTPKKRMSKKVKGGMMPLERNVGSGASKAKNNRHNVVKKIMKEKGLSMIEASKDVKQNNLY